MIYPETDNLSQYPRYVLALLAAKRAQQLRNKEVLPLVLTDSDNPLSIALEEIAQGKVRPIIVSPTDVEVEVIAPDAAAASADTFVQETLDLSTVKETAPDALSEWHDEHPEEPAAELTTKTLADIGGAEADAPAEPEPSVSLTAAFGADEESPSEEAAAEAIDLPSEAIAAPKAKSTRGKKKETELDPENLSNGEVEASVAAVAPPESKPARGKAKKASKEEDVEEEEGAQTA
ncbi:MAG: DNA-directed RNA polymerase subunit omega [Fimbriimonadia bacterium]|nr:DNA-directed RNA polymerase subunit omega [Fimbriimonadia bacterium]